MTLYPPSLLVTSPDAIPTGGGSGPCCGGALLSRQAVPLNSRHQNVLQETTRVSGDVGSTTGALYRYKGQVDGVLHTCSLD